MTYITNLASDPRCLKKKEVWTSADGGASGNISVVQDEKTKLWTYTAKSWYNLFPFVGTEMIQQIREAHIKGEDK